MIGDKIHQCALDAIQFQNRDISLIGVSKKRCLQWKDGIWAFLLTKISSNLLEEPRIGLAIDREEAVNTLDGVGSVVGIKLMIYLDSKLWSGKQEMRQSDTLTVLARIEGHVSSSISIT
jgi:hypothetical protein